MLTHATTVCRRAALDACGGYYQEWARHAEDLELFLRVAERGRLANLDRVLYEVRQHTSSVTHLESERHLYQLKRKIVDQARTRRGLESITELDGAVDREIDTLDHRFIVGLAGVGIRELQDGAAARMGGGTRSAVVGAGVDDSDGDGVASTGIEKIARPTAQKARSGRRDSGGELWLRTDASTPSVAWVLGRFPSTAETFILRQITGLIDRGINLDLYAISSNPDEPVHESVRTYGLLDRVRYAPNVPTGKIRRVAEALKLAAKRGDEGWRLLASSLNRQRYGLRAWSLRPIL